MKGFDAAQVLSGLRDFQLATAEHAFERLFRAEDSTRRFLVADETGLGKTHVARGVIAKTLQHLATEEASDRINVVYVCSNADIAEQNLRKLSILGDRGNTSSTRLTMLITQPNLFRPDRSVAGKPVNFVAFTPATSFDFGWQIGRAEERAVLYLLMRAHLGLRGHEARAARRIFQGGVHKLETFEWVVSREEAKGFESTIHARFLHSVTSQGVDKVMLDLVSTLGRRSRLVEQERVSARNLTLRLRRLLARAAVQALQPDLVILDEFQRFRQLLDEESGGEAAQLAAHLFEQPEARVLLLSATPYKPFTFAEEQAKGDDHYKDFVFILRFLGGAERVKGIQTDLATLRSAALDAEPVADVRTRLESRLTRLMARTERPALGSEGMLVTSTLSAGALLPADVAGYAALHNLASALSAPLTVEYWKAAPYFANFLDGYKIGGELKAALKDEKRAPELRPLIDSAQQLRSSHVRRFHAIDWGNARLRAVAAQTVEQRWWRLLWMPPSLPYHEPAGAFAGIDRTAMTKRLIFSSWVAAPSAIASLLSYEAERQIYTGAGRHMNTPEERRSIRPRLAYRVDEDRPAAMSALSLFWPAPELAQAADPLDAAREVDRLLMVDDVMSWAVGRVSPIVGPAGASRSAASSAWYWAAPLLAEQKSVLTTALLAEDGFTGVVEALAGGSTANRDEGETHAVLARHAEAARNALAGGLPKSERPHDLIEIAALLAIGAPGNIAWRSLQRVQRSGGDATPEGLWKAAALLASGFRNLFNRPEVVTLIDQLYPQPEGAYWQAVARYCIDGDLQAVLDEYLHHLVESEAIDVAADAGLFNLAERARAAIALRPARYVAFDPMRPDGKGIPFVSRFALRFGNVRQEEDDVRLPEVRAAFNSPFWPFVLATTSIGQEGVDFHWWCHAIVHWNLPANPVDFEQREGRVNRYKGHAIRKNVATMYRAACLAAQGGDPWESLFSVAAQTRDSVLGDLKPYWVFTGDAKIERHMLGYPLSRDQGRWEKLRELLALYRLAFGQPRQEDLIRLLVERGVAVDEERLAELCLDLRPPAIKGVRG